MKIKSISEAYSMQPKAWVTETEEQYNNTIKFNERQVPFVCKEIKLERIEIGKRCGDPVEELYYVGYNFQDQKIFQFIANTVNIEYYPATSVPSHQ